MFAAELEKTSLVTWSKLGGWRRLNSNGVEPVVARWKLSESCSLGSSLSPVGDVDWRLTPIFVDTGAGTVTKDLVGPSSPGKWRKFGEDTRPAPPMLRHRRRRLIRWSAGGRPSCISWDFECGGESQLSCSEVLGGD